MALSGNDDLLQHQVGRGMARARLAKGWTQETFARALGIGLKNAQRMEHGRQNLTLRSLARVCAVLGLDVAALLELGREVEPMLAQRADGRMTGLRPTGWLLLRGASLPGAPAMPVYDLRILAGTSQAPQLSRPVGFAVAPEGRHANRDGLFLARVHDDSADPRIQSGQWCLFRQPVAPPLIGKLVLVAEAERDGHGAHCRLKRVTGLKWLAGGVQVRLDATSSDAPAQYLTAKSESELLVLGELVEPLVAQTRARAPQT